LGNTLKANVYIKSQAVGMAEKEDLVQLEGVVTKVLPATMYKVKLPNEQEILCQVSGKMRKHFIRITTGDRVTVEISTYDLSKGRITFRHRD
jgi:translation initiation factor IF-1